MLLGNDSEFLKNHLPFINNLNKNDINILTDACSESELAPGEIIMNSEKKCMGLVLVKSGQLRAYIETEDGREITLYRLLSGDICILTASCVLKNITFEVTLEAEKSSEAIFIPAAVWETLAQKNNVVKEFSMSLVNERFSEVMWVMEQMVSKSMGQRVAAFLLEQYALENSESLSITHETIAKNLGTAREVVSRILKYLENDGLLTLSRCQIRLTDLKRLREMSQ